ncbi:uncharacterized protein CPUR_01394 [Claviceps purpurea 20.1]|uniref:Uncharacterized protein n=1 Tax=Claviceps purpurea (strain 20.1) TaxID=1111077 RepID=M1W2U1_CLAP2|nr:uncharacterized protein CPUR_01394 [Claviceps purpurea 20.1]
MQQLGSSVFGQNVKQTWRPGPPPATFATRGPALEKAQSRQCCYTVLGLLGLDHGAPGWTENMTRRSLSGTMIALPRNSGSYNPRVGFDFRLFDLSTKGHTEEATTPDEPKAANMPDATPGNDNTLAWVSTTEIQLLMPQAAMNIF